MIVSTIRRVGRRKLAALAGIAGLAVVMSGCTSTSGILTVQANTSSLLPLTGPLPFSFGPYPLSFPATGSQNLAFLCGAVVHKSTGNCAGRNVGSLGGQPFVSVGAIGGINNIGPNPFGIPAGSDFGLVFGIGKFGTDLATGTLVAHPNVVYLALSLQASRSAPDNANNTSFLFVIPASGVGLLKAQSDVTAQDVQSPSAALGFLHREFGTNFGAWTTFFQQHPYLSGISRTTSGPGPLPSVLVAAFQCASCATVISTGQQINVGP